MFYNFVFSSYLAECRCGLCFSTGIPSPPSLRSVSAAAPRHPASGCARLACSRQREGFFPQGSSVLVRRRTAFENTLISSVQSLETHIQIYIPISLYFSLPELHLAHNAGSKRESDLDLNHLTKKQGNSKMTTIKRAQN